MNYSDVASFGSPMNYGEVASFGSPTVKFDFEQMVARPRQINGKLRSRSVNTTICIKMLGACLGNSKLNMGLNMGPKQRREG